MYEIKGIFGFYITDIQIPSFLKYVKKWEFPIWLGGIS